MRAAGAAVAVVASLLASSEAIAAAPESRLGSPLTLVGRTGLNPPMIAASSANGVEAFAWVRFRRNVTTMPTGFGGPSSVVQARLRRTSGQLTRAQSLSPKGGKAFVPAIGVDRRGTATAVWLQQARRGRFELVVSVRGPGRRFGRPVTLGHTHVRHVGSLYPGSQVGAEPALAVAADGAAVVAWRGSDALQIAARRPGRCPPHARRACFSRPQSLPLGAEPKAVFDARGRAYVVWVGPLGAGEEVQLAVARPGRRFEPVRVSPPGDPAVDPSIAVTRDGAATVVWSRRANPAFDLIGRIQAAVRSPTGTLSAPVALSDPARFPPGVTPLSDGGGPTIVANPQGEAIVVWQQQTFPETGGGLVTAVRSSVGFGPTQVVDGGQTSVPTMAVDGRGNTALIHFRGAAGFGEWRVRPPGGAFGPPQHLPGSPAFAVGRSRNIITLGVLQGLAGERTRLYDLIID
jgi:hypothetical protein